MRPNPVKAALARGGCAFGSMVFEFFSPGIARIAEGAGADFLLLDMEHSGVGLDTMRSALATFRGLRIAPFVRVPAAQYHFIARVLDLGAMGVMVPMVETREEAEFIVACTRYPPAGRRGAAFGVAAHDDYEDGDIPAKMAGAHERTLVICLIETPTGVRNIDAIAAVPGVDVCWIGHFDLTSFAGIPGQFDHPDYLRSVDAVLAACARHGKAAGFMAVDAGSASECRARGFRCIAASHDVRLYKGALREQIAHLRGLDTTARAQ